MAASQIDASRRESLLASKSKEIADRARKALAVGPQEGRKEVLLAHEEVAKLPGNYFRGASVFQKHCSSCHEFRGRGNALGANLATLQERSSPALLVAVLDPNRAVEAKFQSYTVLTNDGRQFTGLIVAETTSSITLARPDGKRDVILRVDIEEMAGSGKSFMPEGLEKDLSKQELADVFAFLQSGTKEWSADAGDASTAREYLLEAGVNGLAEVQRAPRTVEQANWLGSRNLPATGDSKAMEFLEWKTDPAPADLSPSVRQVFRVPVAFGGLGDSKGEFQLSTGGIKVTFFSSREDVHWESEEGKVQLRFLAVERGPNNASGLLEVEVSSSLIKPGERLSFAVARISEGGGWFAVIPVEGKTVREARR
ncbi:MAG: c-type cytochrome [Planctomycetota bacterium]